MASSRFVYVTYIRTTPQKLWQALRDPEFTKQYWNETAQDCQWITGSSWKLLTPDGRIADSGEIVEIVPERRLVIDWQNHLMADLNAEGFSRLTIDLDQIGDTVKLTLVHEIERPDSKLIAGVSTGWPLILASLKSLLETGSALEVTRHWPKGY